MQINKKVALVVQGGGAKGIYAGAILDYLLDNEIYFPYIIGTSAGALAAANYTAKVKGRNKWCFIKGMNTAGFASIWNYLFKGNYFDFDYMFYKIPKKKCYFDFETFSHPDIEMVACTTSLETGKDTYFSNKECDMETVFEGVAASASFPLIQKHPQLINGKPYLDGGQTAAIPFRRPLEDGYEKIVVLINKAEPDVFKPHSEEHIKKAEKLYGNYPNYLTAYKNDYLTAQDDMEELKKLEKKGIAYIIRPKVNSDVGLATKNKKKLIELYNQGYNDISNLIEEVLDFVSR